VNTIRELTDEFTLMVGGAIGGIVGVYLSLPIVASLRVVWRRFVQSGSPAARANEFRKHPEESVLAEPRRAFRGRANEASSITQEVTYYER